MATTTEAPPAPPSRARDLGIFTLNRGEQIRALVIVGLLVFVLAALPAMLSAYYVDVMTAVTVYTIVAMGLGLLVGRVGLVSLGQVAVLALGAWVGAKLCLSTGMPFPLVIIADGVITAVLGTLVGLPALRLSGLYLALITLMMAGAITVVLNNTNFPNGGPGFLGHTEETTGSTAVRRPAVAVADNAYFRYCVIVAAIMFLIALVHLRGKPGRAWAAIRQSESAALAAGVNITLYKLWAFALTSFFTGVAGALLAAEVGKLYYYQFPTDVSISLLAVVLMGGAYSLWGAILAGMLYKLLPALLDSWGLPADLLTILFGVGVLQVLTTAPQGIVYQFPRDMRNLGRLIGRLFRRVVPARSGAS
jgi:branched-chain amino acid transport system permease protein